MHIVVPTADLVHILSRLQPIKSVKTSGGLFAIYTMEAQDGKLRLIAGDGASFTATTEIFAKVKVPGRISINGTDFQTAMLKIIPVGKGIAGSDNIEMKVEGTKLRIKTKTTYSDTNAEIKQTRDFTLVKAKLSPKDDELPSGYHLSIPGQYMAQIFKVMTKMISAYTSDIAGLSGVMMKIEGGKLLFVVSDGVRLLEIECPYQIQSSDFFVILHKMTCSLIQSLISQGEQVEIYSSQSRIKFITEQDGLKTTLLASLIPAGFPDYSSLFTAIGPTITVDSKIFRDNIMNVRRALDDETYRVKIEFNGKTMSLNNAHASSHLTFSNENIPVSYTNGEKFSLLINAFLLESLLSLMGKVDLNLVVPENDKPIIMSASIDDIKLRSALGVAIE